jgi:DNA repair ATPase RecN
MADVIAEYNDLVVELELYKKQLRHKKRRNSRLSRNLNAYEEARVVLTEAGKAIHKEMVKRIEDLVTLSIRTVYERPFRFHIEFEEKRKTLEARPIIFEGKDEYEIKEDKGGGLIELISFALRIVLWSITEPRTRNFFIFDEPFKRAGIYIEKIGQILRYLSKKLKIQVLIFTHEDELIDICDRVYRVTHDGKESKVFLVKGLKRR